MPVPGGPILADHESGLLEPAEPPRPLGRRQYAFWILQQLAPHSAVSNLSIALRTTRTLRWWPLHAAVNHLVGRHAALRTRFPAAAGVPVRHVSAAADVQLTVEVRAATTADLPQRLQEATTLPFDLGRELPLRVFLFQLSDGGSALLVVVHHIAADAASFGVIVDELASAYEGVANGGGIPDSLRGEVPAPVEPAPRPEDLAYWSAHLRGYEATPAVLPWARPSPAHPTFAGATMVRPITPRTGSAIAALRRTLGGTENLLLLTAFYLTLFRHGAGSDLVLGVPVTGRGSSGAAGIGFQVSTLPLRVVIDPRASFARLARQVRDVFLAGTQHASVSVEEVLAEFGHHSSDWRVPLFRYMYNYRPPEQHDIRLAGERPASLERLPAESRLDIQLTVIGGQAPVLAVTYSTEVHDQADIATLVDRMQVLLQAAAAQPERPVTELDVVTDAERALLSTVNDTYRPPQGGSVLEQFLAWAQSTPTETAVVEDGTTLTYAQLAATVRRVSTRLRADGVRDGDIVALALPRGAAMAAAALAVWAAGGCYLPLNPAQPEGRLASQVRDAGARLVVVEPDGAPPGSAAGTQIVTWSDLTAGPDPASEVDHPAAERPAPELDSAAYVIYTSGSTGRPRGVVITHRNLANLVSDFAGRLTVTAGDATLWSTTTAFDISGLELFLPLSTGGSVVVARQGSQTRPRELLELVVKHDVSVVQATPTFWRLVVPEVSGDELRGRTVLCGGEPMSASLARDLLATGCRLFNVYGPTETTIWSTVAEIAAGVTDPVPIGGPIANTRVFVTDEHGAELPPGLLGELCVAGTGVGVGYLGCPELTEDRFRSSPVWGRYYRTGDLARWRPDGVLELFGRNDRQVKLRGHRIELPEVEAVLRAHADVTDAVVVIVGDPQGDAELRAFVRPAAGVPAKRLPERLWPHLREHLPAYALPSRVIAVHAFPVSPNGKVDYAVLRSREVPAAAPVSTDAAPEGPDRDPALTRRLLALWRDTLGRPGLGERDHFFLNGGHSLLAAQVAGRIGELVDAEVPVRMIFDHPSPRQLSARLAGGR